MRKSAVVFVLIILLVFTSCGAPADTGASPEETSSAENSVTIEPSATPTPTPTPTPTTAPTPSPSPTDETPDSAGSGGIMFDIYRNIALRDINLDGKNEQIEFIAGEDKSKLIINGTEYEVAKKGLAQCFAITDVDKDDKILELAFTDKYNPDLPDGKYAFTHLYWWKKTKIIFMGGLMDVKFDGEWRSGFNPADYFNADGRVTCLTATDELTYLMYMGCYKPSGSDRKLKESKYTAKVIKTKKIKCKKPCLLLKERTEKYYNSAYDYYWIPTLFPYTAGRVPNVDEGIRIIAQPAEHLTITHVYGKYWFRMKTHDGYQGWVCCENKKVKVYYSTMGWKASDIFSGL